jgi:hypothetical protein
MISTTTTNYTGREQDLYILGPVNSKKDSIQQNTLTFGPVSRRCSGVQKLCQKYLILFLTEVGSQEAFPSFGTDFLTNLKNNNSAVTRGDVVHFFNYANLKVTDLLRQYSAENPGIPSDELLFSAELLDYSFSDGVLSLAIQINTQAGDTVPFVVPLPI